MGTLRLITEIWIVTHILQSVVLGVIPAIILPASLAAPVAPIFIGTINQLLLWQTLKFVSLDSVVTFHSSSCYESPARSTVTLIFNSCHLSCCIPVYFGRRSTFLSCLKSSPLFIVFGYQIFIVFFSYQVSINYFLFMICGLLGAKNFLKWLLTPVWEFIVTCFVSVFTPRSIYFVDVLVHLQKVLHVLKELCASLVALIKFCYIFHKLCLVGFESVLFLLLLFI